MRKIFCAAAVSVLMFLVTGQAGAVQITQNEFTTAESLDPGMSQVGVNFSFANDFDSYYFSGRYGLGALFDVGAKLGMIANLKPQERNGAIAGVDLKYQFVKQTEGVPIDIAADIALDGIIISRRNVNEFKFSAIVSRGFTVFDQRYKITPYGGLQLSALFGSYFPENDTNFYIFAGAEWRITQKLLAIAEVKTGATTIGGLSLKVEF